MKKTAFIITIVALISLQSFWCAKPQDNLSPDNTVTVLYPWDEHVLGPDYDVGAKFLVFLPLFITDEHGHMQGKLAEKWSHTEDYRSWTFFLRKDVKWHDGVRFTAQDVKFTLELISRPDILFDGSWSGMRSITVHDDYSLTIDFEASKDFMDDWLVYWPKHILETLDPKDFWSWDFWLQPVGNGPFRYVRHIPNTLLEFEANKDYFAGEPKVKHVVLKFGSKSPITEILSGNVDVLTFFDRSDIPKLGKVPQFRTYYSTLPVYPWLSAIHWNQKDPLFNDPKVRRALTLALDRREILLALNMPEELKIFDVVFTGHQYRHDEIPPPLPFDPKAAGRLLDEAGWIKGGNEVRQRDGKDFIFELIVPPEGTARGAFNEAATLIQAYFRQIGVRMDIQVLEENLFFRRHRSGQFQASINRFYQGGETELLRWVGQDSPIGYYNPRVFELVQERLRTADPDEVNRIFREIIPLWAQDLPLTFLFLQIHTCVVHQRIKGLSSPYRASPLAHMELLWMEQ